MPLRPIVWPRVTVSPTLTSNDDRWPYSDCDAHPVVDDDAVAVDAEPARRAAPCRRWPPPAAMPRSTARSNPRWTCWSTSLPLVEVGAVVGEARFDLRVAELDERAVPQPCRTVALRSAAICSAFSRRSSPLILRNAGSISAPRGSTATARASASGFPGRRAGGTVVELDAALPERLREHVVDEAGFASLPASSRAKSDDRRARSSIVAAARRTRP